MLHRQQIQALDYAQYASTMTWKGKPPVVSSVTTTYQTGGKLTKETMDPVESQIQRLPSLRKWFVDIDGSSPANCFNVEHAESPSRSTPVFWPKAIEGTAHSGTIRWKHLAGIVNNSYVPK